jgi:hypothetical protein
VFYINDTEPKEKKDQTTGNRRWNTGNASKYLSLRTALVPTEVKQSVLEPSSEREGCCHFSSLVT